MEKKTTQRIIGILVVAALIIILLPLLFNGNAAESSKQTAETKAPPFPDQASQPADTIAQQSATTNQPAQDQGQQASLDISQSTANAINNAASSNSPTGTDANAAAAPTASTTTTSSTDSSNPATSNAVVTPASTDASTAANPVAPSVASPVTSPVTPPVASTTSSTSSGAQPAPGTSDAASLVAQPVAAVNTTAPVKDTIATPATPKADEGQAIASIAVKEKPIATKTPAHVQKIKHAKPVTPQLTQHDLVNLKNSAWVIQMGSFKNKSNAIRLTNRLRAQGYKAFTREVRSTMRVYVGPEFKQASAASLANKIQQQLNMRGIVVSYKPLEL